MGLLFSAAPFALVEMRSAAGTGSLKLFGRDDVAERVWGEGLGKRHVVTMTRMKVGWDR